MGCLTLHDLRHVHAVTLSQPAANVIIGKGLVQWKSWEENVFSLAL